MLFWCSVILVLGIVSFLDSFYNYGMIFRQVNSLLFMLLGFGIWSRVYRQTRKRYWEQRGMQEARMEMSGQNVTNPPHPVAEHADTQSYEASRQSEEMAEHA